MNILSVFQFLSSPSVSFIVSLAGFFVYKFFPAISGRSISSLESIVLFPASLIWAVFFAALLWHMYIFLKKLVFLQVQKIRKRREVEMKSASLKKNAKLFFDKLNDVEVRVMFELLEAPGYTCRLDSSHLHVRNLESLGMIVSKKRISVFEHMYSLNLHVIDYVKKAYMPFYFNQVRRVYNHKDTYQRKLMNIFYEDDFDMLVTSEDSFVSLVNRFERENLLTKEVNFDSGEIHLVLNEFFVLYLDKILGDPPARNIVRVQ